LASRTSAFALPFPIGNGKAKAEVLEAKAA